MSNFFTVDLAPDAAWAGLVAVAGVCFPGLPLVGYERGDDLAPALAAGFTTVGPLQVWFRPS